LDGNVLPALFDWMGCPGFCLGAPPGLGCTRPDGSDWPCVGMLGLMGPGIAGCAVLVPLGCIAGPDCLCGVGCECAGSWGRGAGCCGRGAAGAGAGLSFGFDCCDHNRAGITHIVTLHKRAFLQICITTPSDVAHALNPRPRKTTNRAGASYWQYGKYFPH